MADIIYQNIIPEPVEITDFHVPTYAEAETIKEALRKRLEKEDTDKIELTAEKIGEMIVEILKASKNGINPIEWFQLFFSASAKAKVIHDFSDELKAEIEDLSPEEAKLLYAKLGEIIFESIKTLKDLKGKK